MGHTLENVTAGSVCHHTFGYLRVFGPPSVERCYDTMLFCVSWREDAELCGCSVEESLYRVAQNDSTHEQILSPINQSDG